jgi:hypothetical protein
VETPRQLGDAHRVSKTSIAIEGLALAVVSAALGLIYAIAGSE